MFEEIRAWLVGRIADRLGVPVSEIDPRLPLDDFGLSSRELVVLSGELQDRFSCSLSPTVLWEFPTIEKLARHLSQPTAPASMAGPSSPEPEPIAIVGIGCRFPGAHGPRAFWNVLHEGLDCIREVPPDRWQAEAYYDAKTGPGKMNSRWGGFLEGIDEFDAEFFGISPREAERMDPQQRLLLETSWETFEDAGIDPTRLAGSPIGVFVGISTNDYGRRRTAHPADIDVHDGTGNALSIAANRISYFYDFRGPSLAIDTACSSSLVAVHLASDSLRKGESRLALAGGVNVILLPEIGIAFSQAGLTAADGRCKSFDDRADGYVRSEGVGLVLLKPLSQALKDGDPIYAILRGSAVVQDGRTNGLVAPNGEAQVSVLRTAWAKAGVEPSRIQYVETHGAGTLIGDAIEARSLAEALEGRPCLLGSVKTNLGHMEAASGIAGLIKVSLALRHGSIPPSLHFERQNRHLRHSIRIVQSPEPWPTHPALAGVSSFGFGGTSCHAVLEEAPPREASLDSRSHHLLPISAKSESALEAVRDEILRSLSHHSLAEVSRTLQTGRAPFEFRRFVVAHDSAEAMAKLRLRDPHCARVDRTARPVVFLFPGLGDHVPGMTRDLYESEPVFREHVDRFSEIVRGILPLDPRSVLLEQRTEEGLPPTEAQTSLLVVELALAHLWQVWGIRPTAVIGHSLGEFAAASVAGVLDTEDALRLVALRARLMERLPGGAMLAVPHSVEELRPYLGSGVCLAAINAPSLCVASGEFEAIRILQGRLEEAGVVSQRLNTPRAFHSPMMEPIETEFRGALEAVALHAPSIPMISTVTGRPLTPEQAKDPGYWASQLRLPVRFSEGVEHLLRDSHSIFLEVGPGRSLSSFLLLQDPRRTALPSLPHRTESRSEIECVLHTLGRLWTSGCTVNWEAFQGGTKGLRISLPARPFDRRRFWIDAPANRVVRLYLPSWKRHPLSPPTPASRKSWLILEDQDGLGRRLAERLRSEGAEVVLTKSENLDAQLAEVDASRLEILDLRSLAPSHSLEEAQRLGFDGVVNLGRALARAVISEPVRITVVTSQTQAVESHDVLLPERTTIYGPGLSLSQEYPNLAVRFLDVRLEQDSSEEALWNEIHAPSAGNIAALRGRHRWEPTYEPVPASAARSIPVRQGGTYVLFGGTGRIGGWIADFLSSRGAGRLILVGRSARPDSAGDRCCVAGDIADEARVREILSQAGQIHGVVHAAGLVDPKWFAPVPETTSALRDAHFRAKVHGLQALDRAIAGSNLDFCLCISSLSAVLGGLGFSAYAAANRFMDSFAGTRKGWISVDWDGAVSQEEALEVLSRVFDGGAYPQVIVSTEDLDRRLSAWTNPRREERVAARHTRSRLRENFVPPQRPAEIKIAAVWSEVLGLDAVGLHDNFFDVGGNSLLGTQVASRLRRAFRVDLPLRVLFDSPTVAGIAEAVERALIAQLETSGVES